MKDNQGAVIICAGGMSSSVVAARSLGRHDIPIVAVAFERSHPLLKTKYADETHIITSPEEDYDQFRASLANIAEQKHIHTLLPLNDYDIYTITKYADLYEDLLELPIVDWSTFEKTWDRKRLLSIASDLGIKIPKTDSLSTWDRWSEPSVIKSRYTILESNGSLLSPGVELVDAERKVDTQSVKEKMHHEPLVQQYVDEGTEFGFFAVANQGDPIATFQHRRLRSTNYFGGASAYRTAVRDSTLETLGRDLLKELEWHGPAMVEFRRNDATGEYKLMEINPRFWGSLALPIAAGVDFPWIYYQLSRGTIKQSQVPYEVETNASYLRAELQHLQSLVFDEYPSYVDKPKISRTLVDQVSTLPRSSFDMLSVDDPAPFIWDYLYSVHRILKN